jgi:enoyl-CoA hydratase/carnithine racemase
MEADMSETPFNVTETDGVAHIQFVRPQAANSMTMAFWREFPAAVRQLDGSGKARALVVSGQGKHFCSGMDLSVLQSAELQAVNSAVDREAFVHTILELQRALSAVEEARFPVIAAVQGACIGAGLDLAAACDLRYAQANAYFRIEEINIGMMADAGSLQRLPHKLPDAILREMAFTGATLSAARAKECGFINDLAADPVAQALSVAAEIARRAPVAVAGSKRALNFARDHSVAEALEQAALLQGGIWEPKNIAAAIEARKTKSAAKFAALKPRR